MVISANNRLHDVNHHSAAVDDDPFAVVFAFHPWFAKPRVSDTIAHTGSQSFGLSVRGTAGNHHALEQGGQMFGIEDDDVLRFDVFQTVDNASLKFLNVFFFSGFCHGVPNKVGCVGCNGQQED